jgi:HK97 gp10 family phage protein
MTVTLTGQKEIDAVLRQMPLALTHSVLGTANIDASRPLVDREHLLAPVGRTGDLAESIGAYRVSQKSATSIGEVRVGPRRQGGFKGYHAHLVEFGTVKRQTKKGANRGIMRAKPFIKPAFNQTKAEVERRITRSIGNVLLRTMKRYIRG